MELKSVFEIVKADRYSQEGCEKIAAETEDKIYKTGEISTATGLQKQPDGSWAPPKNGAGPVKGDKKKADKERAERSERADQKASAARKEAEERKLSGPDMKDFFLAKSYEGASVEMAQRGLEAQGFDLIEGNDDVNVYERPEGSRITMKLDGNKIKSADFKTPEETAKESRSLRANFYEAKNPGAAGSDKPKDGPYLDEQGLHDIYMDIKNNELEHFSTEQIAKEYKITKGDAEVIKNRIENNKRAKEQDKQDRRDQAAAQTNSPAKQKHYSFVKAGHHYRVPASSPAEAVQLLKSRGVKGFEESDAFDEDTPRTPAPEDAAPDRTYTQQSINGWREMTGDTKIRIKK